MSQIFPRIRVYYDLQRFLNWPLKAKAQKRINSRSRSNLPPLSWHGPIRIIHVYYRECTLLSTQPAVILLQQLQGGCSQKVSASGKNSFSTLTLKNSTTTQLRVHCSFSQQCVQFWGFFPIVGIFGGQVGINIFKWGFFLQVGNP